MRNHARPTLRIAISVLVLLSYLSLTTTFAYSSVVLLLPILAIAFMPLGEWLERRFSIYTTVSTFLTATFGLGLLVAAVGIPLLDTVTYLVMYIQIYSMVHIKHENNYNHIILMSFFIVLAACMMSPSATIGLVLILFIFVAVWTFFPLEIYAACREGELDDRADLIDLDARETLLTESRPNLIDWRLASYVSVFALLLIGTTGAFFFFSPRTEAGLLGATNRAQFEVGLSQEVDLSTGGQLLQTGRPVMHVVFPETEDGRYDGTLFWRATTFDQYTGSGWTRRGVYTPQFDLNESYRRFAHGGGFGSTEGLDRVPFRLGTLVKQEVFLDEIPETGVPTLPLAQMIVPRDGQKGIRFQWGQAGDFTVHVNRKASSGINYTAWSEVITPTPQQLRNTATNFEDVITQRDFEHLTNHNLSDRTLELVEDLTEDADTRYDEIMAIMEYLTDEQNYIYTTRVPDVEAGSPVESFLHTTRTGHCQLFASAMALMLRSKGIPTRVVSGFRGGEFDEVDESYTIYADYAHLWVEVFFPEFGWVTFDPSPRPDDIDFGTISAVQRYYSRYLLRAKMIWLRNVVGFQPEDRLDVAKELTFRVRNYFDTSAAEASVAADPGEITGRGNAGRMTSPLVAGLLFATFVFIVFFAIQMYRTPKTVKRTYTDDQQRAIKLHGALMKRLQRLGIDGRGMSVDEIRAEIHACPWEDKQPALQALAAYNAARFGARPFEESVFSQMVRAVQRFRPVARAAG